MIAKCCPMCCSRRSSLWSLWSLHRASGPSGLFRTEGAAAAKPARQLGVLASKQGESDRKSLAVLPNCSFTGCNEVSLFETHRIRRWSWLPVPNTVPLFQQESTMAISSRSMNLWGDRFSSLCALKKKTQHWLRIIQAWPTLPTVGRFNLASCRSTWEARHVSSCDGCSVWSRNE